jgi:uncharacterized membrane protein YgcG
VTKYSRRSQLIVSAVTLVVVGLFMIAIMSLPAPQADAHTCNGSASMCGDCKVGRHWHSYNGKVYCDSTENLSGGSSSSGGSGNGGASSGGSGDGGAIGELIAQPLDWGLFALLVALGVGGAMAVRSRAASLPADR